MKKNIKDIGAVFLALTILAACTSSTEPETEAPVVSTEAPVVSTEAPVVSTEAPVVSTEAPVVTEEIREAALGIMLDLCEQGQMLTCWEVTLEVWEVEPAALFMVGGHALSAFNVIESYDHPGINDEEDLNVMALACVFGDWAIDNMFPGNPDQFTQMDACDTLYQESPVDSYWEALAAVMWSKL
jgi:hypothetical protein